MDNYDLAIIGAGAAGLAAARYAHEHELRFLLVYEAMGGKAGQFLHERPLSQTRLDYEPVAPMPSDDWMRSLTELVTTYHHDRIEDRVEQVERRDDGFTLTLRAHGSRKARAVIVATGVGWHEPELPGIQRFHAHGVSYSIKTYAHLAAGASVAVIGASSRTLRGVAELARRAYHVFWLVPEPAILETPIGNAISQQQSVEVLVGYSIQQLVGFHHVEEVVVKKDAAIRRLSVDHLFVDLGIIPHSGSVCDLVDLNTEGFIVVDQFHATSVPGLFAAGDVTTQACEHAIAALGDGTRAAMSAYDFLLASWLSAAGEPASDAPPAPGVGI